MEYYQYINGFDWICFDLLFFIYQMKIIFIFNGQRKKIDFLLCQVSLDSQYINGFGFQDPLDLIGFVLICYFLFTR